MFKWIKEKIAASPTAVVTGPGVIKVHNVECRFRHAGTRYGKLGQDRWSDGQERFTLRLNRLPIRNGFVMLYRAGELVSEFEVSENAVRFAWKGMSDESIPQFEIGEELSIEAGDMVLTGIVEAD